MDEACELEAHTPSARQRALTTNTTASGQRGNTWRCPHEVVARVSRTHISYVITTGARAHGEPWCTWHMLFMCMVAECSDPT